VTIPQKSLSWSSSPLKASTPLSKTWSHPTYKLPKAVLFVLKVSRPSISPQHVPPPSEETTTPPRINGLSPHLFLKDFSRPPPGKKENLYRAPSPFAAYTLSPTPPTLCPPTQFKARGCCFCFYHRRSPPPRAPSPAFFLFFFEIPRTPTVPLKVINAVDLTTITRHPPPTSPPPEIFILIFSLLRSTTISKWGLFGSAPPPPPPTPVLFFRPQSSSEKPPNDNVSPKLKRTLNSNQPMTEEEARTTLLASLLLLESEKKSSPLGPSSSVFPSMRYAGSFIGGL